AVDVVEAMGGKGCDVSLILRELGVDTVATGLAGGDNGRRMEQLLRNAGVTPDFVWTRGETRLNTVLIETDTGDHTTLCAAGLRPDEAALSGLSCWLERWAASADAIVLAGSLPESWPPSVYADLVTVAHKSGKPVIVDVAGPALLAAVDCGVTAIKPNLDELWSTTDLPPFTRGDRGGSPLNPTPDSILEAARALHHRGAQRVLVSRGPAGALLLSERGVWDAPGLEVDTVNPAGAGDGMTACLALAAAHGWDETETLRWAIAVSAAIVTTRGTAEVYRHDIDKLISKVIVNRLA
ncbi:MAG: 1-phosphofructokinase family hexose kinase, partial [Actinomycetota bacterium]